MKLELMGPRRHSELCDAATACIHGINDGDEPTRALVKVAKAFDLNSKEIAEVSHTVNNAMTNSQLANSETPEERGAPFVLTDAESAAKQLFPDADAEEKTPHNGTEPGKRPEVKSPTKLERPEDMELPGIGTKSKTASEHSAEGLSEDENDSYDEHTNFNAKTSGNPDEDSETENEFVKTAREVFGYDPLNVAQPRVRITAGLNGLSSDVDFGCSDHRIKTAGERGDPVGAGRLVGNPLHELQNLKAAAEEARTLYNGARDIAFAKLARAIEIFKRADAPKFSRVELLAKHAGVDVGTLDVVFASGGLDRLGHTRSAPNMKLASYVVATCSSREKDALDTIRSLEGAWKTAGDAGATQADVDARVEEMAPVLWKLAAEGGDSKKSNGGGLLNKATSGLTGFLSEAPGAALGGQDISEVLGGVVGNRGTDKPDYGLTGKSPLDAGGQQRLRNANSAGNLSGLMDDPYIAQRPITDIVQAFNTVMATHPNVDPTMMRRLVKDQLAGGGDLDTDVLLNLHKSTKGGRE